MEHIKDYYLNKWKPKTHKELTPEIYDKLKEHGEGIYYVNLKSTGEDFISRAIGWFCHGWVHSVIFVYSENIKQYLTGILNIKQYKKVLEALQLYYGLTARLDDIKALVISSSDAIGQTAFDLSNYNTRSMTIRKITDASNFQKEMIINFLVNQLGQPYDYTGLVFYPLNFLSGIIYRLFDSKYYFCSEIVYEACTCMKNGIFLSKKPNPTPYELEKYNAYNIIYDSTKQLTGKI